MAAAECTCGLGPVLDALSEATHDADALTAANKASFEAAMKAGEKVAEDAGVKWCRKAAEQGDPDAQFDLGLMYMLVFASIALLSGQFDAHVSSAWHADPHRCLLNNFLFIERIKVRPRLAYE